MWKNQQFWEAVFYQDVQREIRSLYLESSASAKCYSSLKSNGTITRDVSFSLWFRTTLFVYY